MRFNGNVQINTLTYARIDTLRILQRPEEFLEYSSALKRHMFSNAKRTDEV